MTGGRATMTRPRALRFVALFLWIVSLILLLLSQSFFMWMRDTKGFFYLLVIFGNLWILANLSSKGEAIAAPGVLVVLTIVPLAVAWVLGFPLVVGVSISLGAAFILHLMTRATTRHRRSSDSVP